MFSKTQSTKMVSRYVGGSSSLSFFFFFFFFFFLGLPLGYSQLPSDQVDAMVKLSKLIQNNTAPSPWGNVVLNRNPCLWVRVSCSLNGSSIMGLSLHGFSISSPSIFPVIGQIESLQTLDLSNNRLSSIPDGWFTSGYGGMNGLKLLNFSRNWLSGNLPTFHGFSGLETLDLSYNNLNGSIDLQLDELVGLKSLNLSNNHFTGSVPTHLGKSKVLEKLELSKNLFQGEIPEEIVSYRNLTVINLSENKLSGSIPGRIGELSKLELLVLSSNHLNGEIPRTLFSIDTLLRFAANQNNFTGAIPSRISPFLQSLDLSFNRLDGLIPSDFLSKQYLQTVDLTGNLLEGPIPENLTPSLVRLRLGSNLLNGSIPSAPFGSLQNLTYLELDNNNLSGSIPSHLGSCQNLTLLNLANNKLTGVLPEQLSNLSHLHVMKLQSNNLKGNIPAVISGLKSLLILNISLNSLGGLIPSSISKLQNLTNLCLQSNNLSGSIPDSINSLSSLLELQLGNNQLIGDIPQMPSRLQIALNLSRNLFEGPIPETLSQLPNLEVLDLSNNKFSGGIPIFLTHIETLIQLTLSNNRLSGVIPNFNSLVNVNITGNLGLVKAKSDPPSPAITAPPKKTKSVVVAVIVAASTAVAAVGIIALIALAITKRFYRVNDEPIHSGGSLSHPQVIQGNLLTTNSIHRSNINFAKAMEVVSSPSNIKQKTRFSTYYKAIMPSGMSYFIKKLNWSDKIFQLGSHEKFGEEMQILGKLSNSNVMTPLAYALTADSAYIFYEFPEKGTLFDILHGGSGNAVDWTSRYSIALGVAQGLSFLHGFASGSVLLLDLSSKTILLKSMKEPQIGDIELYKVIDPSKSTSSFSMVAGTAGYIPPEYAYTMRVTAAGNVYSFGVILLELLTGKAAVSEGMELAKWALSNSAQQGNWDPILDFNISRTSFAVRSQMLAVLKIALGCVSVSPEARPRMKSVLHMLINAR